VSRNPSLQRTAELKHRLATGQSSLTRGAVKEAASQARVQPSARRLWFRCLGGILTLLSAGGFVVVADDTRHTGEILAVTSILIAGLALLGASFPNAVSRKLTLPWLAAGSLTGSLAGAAVDHMLIGVAGGVLLGVALGTLWHPRAPTQL
jgi:hypothetical protein